MQTSQSGSAAMPSTQPANLPAIGGRYFALAVLFSMNLLNYVDRYSFFAVGVDIKRDFHVDDFWYSVLGVSFMIVYTVVAPFMGWLAIAITGRSYSPVACSYGASQPSEPRCRLISGTSFSGDRCWESVKRATA